MGALHSIGSIAVPRDYPGIRQAAMEMLEEALLEGERDQALQKFLEREQAGGAVANRDRALEDLQPKARSLSPGYYDWAAHLFDLELSLSVGFKVGLADVRNTELLGLRVIRSARTNFERSHPACGKCGALNMLGALRCRKCDQSFDVRERKDA